MATQRRAGGGKATEGALAGHPVGGLLRGAVMGKTAGETAGRGRVGVWFRQEETNVAALAGSGRRGVSAASGRRLDAGYREEVSDVGGLRADDAGAPEGVDGVQAREAGWTGRVLPEKGASE